MSWTESDAAHKLIRSKNRKTSRIARKSSIKSKAQKDAEGMEMTPDIMDYPGLPVVPDSYGTNSALESGQGVPQWYGSAESFEAMAFHNPSGDDRDDAKAQFKMTYPGFTMSNSSLQYLIYQSGSSNKYHMFWLAQDKSGGWYAFSGYGRIGYAARMVRITGPTSQETAMRAMQSKINKKVGKGYTNVSRDFGMNAEYQDMMCCGEQMEFYDDEKPYYFYCPVCEESIETGEFEAEKQTKMSCDMSYCPREAIYTSKTGSKYCVEHQIAFNCDGCGKPIVRDSEEHENCHCDDEGEKWWCDDCEVPENQDMMCCGEQMEFYDDEKPYICSHCLTIEFDAEASDKDWDRTEYEYKELEIAKPFRTAFMASLGFVVAPLVLIAGLAFALGDE